MQPSFAQRNAHAEDWGRYPKKIASAYLPQKETHVKSWSIGASNELIKPEV